MIQTRRSILIVLCLGLLPIGGCSTNPATGKMQLNIISEAEEVQLGGDLAPKFIGQMGGEIPDAKIRQYVSNIGLRMARGSERPTLPWAFHVVDSSMLNAFALPGGKIFVSRGLIRKLSNEAELAVGDATTIGSYCILNGGHGLRLGDHCIVAAFAYFNSSDHAVARGDLIQRQGFVGAPIEVGDDVWIGGHVYVGKGVTIGRGSVVGAGAVVVRDIPDHKVAVGNPARVVKDRE